MLVFRLHIFNGRLSVKREAFRRRATTSYQHKIVLPPSFQRDFGKQHLIDRQESVETLAPGSREASDSNRCNFRESAKSFLN